MRSTNSANQVLVRHGTGISVDPLLAPNPNLEVSATVTSNHQTIMRKDYPAIVDAVRKTAAIHQQPAAGRLSR